MKNKLLITAILLILISATATAYEYTLRACLPGRYNTDWYTEGIGAEEYFYHSTGGSTDMYLICPIPGTYEFSFDVYNYAVLHRGTINHGTGAIAWESCGTIGINPGRHTTLINCTSNDGLFKIASAGGVSVNVYKDSSQFNAVINTTKNYIAGTWNYLPYVNFMGSQGAIAYSHNYENFFYNTTDLGVGTFSVLMPSDLDSGGDVIEITNYNDVLHTEDYADHWINSTGCPSGAILGASPAANFNPIAGVNNEFRAFLNDSSTIVNTIWRINGEDTSYEGYLPVKQILFNSPGQVEVEVIYETTCGTFVINTWSGFCNNYLSLYGYVYEELPDLSKDYIGDVLVIYRNTQDNTTYSARSDLGGYYEINQFTPGVYNISVSQDGYKYFNILKNISYNYSTRVRQDIKLNSTYSYAEYIFTVDEITNTATGTFNPIDTFNLTVYNEVGSPMFAWIDDTAYNYSNSVSFVYKYNNQISLLLDRYYTFTINISVGGYRCWLDNTGSVCSLTETIEYDSLWNMIFINESNLASASNITVNFKDTNNTAINRATVSMYYYGNNTIFGTGLTNSDGQVNFLNIPEASYYWTLTADNFSAWRSDPKTIYRSENLTFTLKRIVQDYTIYGKVSACSDSGIQTESGLVNVFINLTQGEMTFVGYTDSGGNYQIKVKKSDSPYYFKAQKEGFNSRIDNDYYTVGGVSFKDDFCLIRLAGFNAVEVLTQETNATHIIKIGNVSVNVYKDGVIYDTGQTNFYGKVIFSLPTGSYRFTAIKEGYYPEVYPIDEENVYIKADKGITINMQARGILEDLKDLGIPTNEKEFTKFIDGYGIVILVLLILVMAFSSMIIMVKKTGII